jgi:PIN domain nuclease of toxin-antitoxin system
VKYLVDTNGWIGYFDGDPSFGKTAKAIMTSPYEECYVSIASLWEASIKVGLGKLKLPYDLVSDIVRLLQENGFEILPIEVEDVLAVRSLEAIHGDPFDRIQCVQARRKGWKMISRDPVFDRYGLKRVW